MQPSIIIRKSFKNLHRSFFKDIFFGGGNHFWDSESYQLCFFVCPLVSNKRKPIGTKFPGQGKFMSLEKNSFLLENNE